MIKPGKPTDPNPINKSRQRAVEKFISKKLLSFAGRDPSAPPIIDVIDGKNRTAHWRWFINHFFFIERGRIEKEPDYMALINKRGTEEIELVFANINLPETCLVLSSDTKTWGENWFEDVERTEEAVISSMLEFLFDGGYIIADVGNTEDLEFDPPE